MKRIGQNTLRTKVINKSLVLQTLLDWGQISRQQIAEITSLTPATITNIAGKLIEEGLVKETGTIEGRDSRAGRKSVALDLREDTIKVIGVHIRLDYIEIGLVNLKGQLEQRHNVVMPPNISETEFQKLLTEKLTNFIDENKGISISAIGIGALGLVNFEEGEILSAINLGWSHMNLSSHIQKKFHVPVYIDNNVRAMTLAEKMFGQSKRLNNFMSIYIGQGIGAGLVINGQIYRGGITGAGEFGHMTYIPDGQPCWCGNRGCLERYASEAAITKTLNNISIPDMLEAANRGDLDTLSVLETAGESIAVVLTSFINMFHIQKVTFGGKLANEKYPLVKKIREIVNERSFLARQEEVKVEVTEMGENIGLLGAASLALLYGVFQSQQN
jgi:N-acetylglucosamine repressor